MKPQRSFLLLFVALVLPGVSVASTENQLLNLHNPPPKARHNLTLERTWPSSPGDAALCLWRGDKTAAISYTIDDNCAMNVDWWLKEAGDRGIQLTWFLVTGGIDGGSRPKMSGTWDLWRRVHAAGHGIESHTMTHLAGARTPETWKGIEWEYSESKLLLEKNIPGLRVTSVAYPGGGETKHNDESIAARHYLAGRSFVGKLNGAFPGNYMALNAMSRANINERPQNDFSNMVNILNPDKKEYRGWGIIIYHYIKESDTAVVEGVRRALDYSVANRDEIWAGAFGEIARYAQQRDTATVTVKARSASNIALSVTDRMDNRYYDTPLTVKVRLPGGWTRLDTRQNGQPVNHRIVSHQGASYALVDIVPDKGDALIAPLR